MSKRLKALRDKRAALINEADALAPLVDAGTATAEQVARFNAISGDPAKAGDTGELGKLAGEVEREERLVEARRLQGDATEVVEQQPVSTVPAQPKPAPGAQGKFTSFGEQLGAIARASAPGVGSTEWDRRLVSMFVPGQMAAPSGMNEGVPSEGGFLVQMDFASPILETLFAPGTLLSRVRRVPISANSNGLKIPALDETSRVDGSRYGGIRAYWAAEAGTVTATKPRLREMELSLKKLMGLGYATEELLADSTALGALMTRAFTEEIQFKTEDGVVNGDGSGKPLGFLNSGALVTVAKESGQAGATIVTQNILNMFSRLPPRSMTRAVWLVNQDVLPQLFQLTLGSGTAVVLLYRPPGVDGPNVNAPAGTLLGLPVIPVEYCATLGTVGDIVLVDLDQYMMIDKNGIQQAASMHVRFVYDEMTFRFVYRVDGQPLWRSAVTPFKGSATKSPYVTLATRS